MASLCTSNSSGSLTSLTVNQECRDIAIIGLACRFAGDAVDAERYWELLCNARSAFSETSRFNPAGFYDNGSSKLNRSSTKGGHFLRQDISAFDANFFSISNNEALAMDPQQRLMLEVAYEAFENAGLPMESVAGTQTSCFVGNFTTDYREMLFRDPEAAPLYTVTGTGTSLISNRVSWFFDLRGPSFTVNTACSSSLVALRQACQSLQLEESNMAIVGGSNLILSPEMFMFFSNQNFLSRDGLCKSFDAAGDGYSRGEGVAAIVLKRVIDAVRDGDPIRAVIRGTGINQDGMTKGITLPSAQAQADLISSTYNSAGLDFRDTRFFEAHGTGTKAGDPLELEAISKTISATLEPGDTLIVGSAKANIGHTEATAGLAGVIKGIYILEKGVIPPNIHFHNPNPMIPFDKWNILVPKVTTAWPTNELRRLSVNSFGYSGTNAHVILDDAFSYLTEQGLRGIHFTKPSKLIRSLDSSKSNIGKISETDFYQPKSSDVVSHNIKRLFVFSAHDEDGLKRQKESYAKYFREISAKEAFPTDNTGFLRNLAFTLSEKRSRFPWRTYAIASSVEELRSELEATESNSLACRSVNAPRIGFIFTGQGAQWPKMGRELFQFPIFRRSVEDADTYLRSECGCPWSTIEEMHRDEASSKIDHPAYSQPICTILQVALVDLLKSWTITPCSIAGHSSGEMAGAYCLGALSREDAWRVAYYRGLLSSQIQKYCPDQRGAMLAVGSSRSQAETWISQVHQGRVVVACVNSPSSVTVSGDASGIDELYTTLKKADVFARKLKVTTAYHSPHMNMIVVPYLETIHDIRPRLKLESRKMYSSVSGGLVDAAELGPIYWVRNLVSPVLFSDAVHELLRPLVNYEGTSNTAVDILLEIGPHSALLSPVNEIMKEYKITGVQYLPVLSRGRDGIDTLLGAVGALFACGVAVDIGKVNTDTDYVSSGTPQVLVTLPSYKWNHSKTYWGESRISKEYRLRKFSPSSLLGAPCPAMGEFERIWRGFIRVSDEQWLQDHQIQGSILYPAAGYLAMAIEAVRQTSEQGREISKFKLRDVQITAAAVLSENSSVECICQLRPHLIGTRDRSSTWFEFTISTCADQQKLQQNCSGLILAEHVVSDDDAINGEGRLENQIAKHQYDEAQRLCTSSEDPQEFYKELAILGLMYGPDFRRVSRIQKRSGQSCCDVDALAPMTHESGYRLHIIHPATLDAMFHTVFAAFKSEGGLLKEAMVPTSIDEVVITAQALYEDGNSFKGFSHASWHGFRELMGDLTMLDQATAQVCVAVKGFRCVAVSGMNDPAEQANETIINRFCQRLVWEPAIHLLSSDKQRQIIDAATSRELSTAMARKAEMSEMIAFVYIRRALALVTLDMVQGKHHKLLWNYMQDLVKTANSNSHPLQAITQDWHSIEERTEHNIESQVEAEGVGGKALCQIGRNLDKILRGEQTPTQLLKSSTLMGNSFFNMGRMEQILSKIKNLVHLMMIAKPGLSVLEIGTATGGVATAILSSTPQHLEGLPQPVEYTFSCSSESALQELEAGIFHGLRSSMKFKPLSVQRNLQDQAFENQSFDMVIMSDVFDTNGSLDGALVNIQKLLKPQGKLCILKATGPGLRLTTVLESLPFISSKTNLDKLNSPWDIKAWRSLLGDRFDLDFISRDYEDWRYRQFSLIVSTVRGLQGDGEKRVEVVIVEAANASQKSKVITSRLVSEFEHRSVATSTLKWGDTLPSLKGKQFISLLELEEPFLGNMRPEDFAVIKLLVLQSSNLLWISNIGNPAGSLAVGMARSIRNEVADMQFRTLQIYPTSLDSLETLALTIVRLATTSDKDSEFFEENGILKISRVVENLPMNKQMRSLMSNGKEYVEDLSLQQANAPHKLAIQSQGMLDTLCYEADDTPTQKLADDEVEIKVKASGMNFRDIMVAMGHIPDSFLGFEASGTIIRIGCQVKNFRPGDYVCTLGHGAHRQIFRNKATLVQHIPQGLSFEEAASLPLVHCTAYNALIRIARAEPGQSVLIHAAAGGVGQVALQIAKHIGMEIYATVGSSDKRALIREIYDLPDDHIFSSRDLSFFKGVMRMTQGRGVDVVLNSLSGEALRQTWRCIAPFGTFVEIGLRDILANTRLDMEPFSKDASFTFFNLSHVLQANPKLMAQILEGAFDYLRKGITKPVSPLQVYPVSKVENAFRLMQTGKHRGKIALSWDVNEVVPVLHNSDDSLHLDGNATYVLIGGLGGIGRSLASFLTKHGAKHLCFISRSGATSVHAQDLIRKLLDQQIRVKVSRCNIADKESLAIAMAQCSKQMPPIGGAIQCAMDLQDALFENMTYEQWTASLRPKVDGSWNLHTLLPQDIQFFIILSSFAGIFGNRGQSNYAAAGAFEDILAHYRRQRGLKAVAIDLGIMRDVGIIAEKGATDYLKEWEEPFGLGELHLHALMKGIIADQRAGNNKIPPQITTGFATGGAAQAAGIRRPYYFDDPRFSILEKTGRAVQGGSTTSGPKEVSLQKEMAMVESFRDAANIVTKAMVAKVAKSLQTSSSEIDPSKPLHTYGVDSLVAIEMRNWILKDIKSNVSLFDVLSGVPMTALAEKIAENSKLLREGIA